ncbi:MAG: carboxypeptidase-like regulatory domain-containing protein [Cyanobacteriota bacterium]|nr:carboxypeptidase-like regulatory domain-containing protein [Cyanobacteriota bacterium]
MRVALLGLAAIAASLIAPRPSWGHGVSLEYQLVNQVQIQAGYDSGTPMAQAQVMIYAPGNASSPWSQGTTDAEGRFSFSPDGNQPGYWQVMVRQAGHGQSVTVPVGEITATPAPALGRQSTSLGQRWLPIAAVIWGFVGTALFFSRPPHSRHPDSGNPQLRERP